MQPADRPRTMPVLAKFVLVAVLVVGAIFHLMLATGAASFVGECENVACGQLLQMVITAVTGVALLIATYRAIEGRRVAKFVFLCTLPAFLFHLGYVLVDPNESVFFPVATGIAPLFAGASVLLDRSRSQAPG